MTSPHAQHVGNTVRAEMARRRVTQAQAAAVLGLSQAAVSRRLLGQVPFSAEELQQLGTLLGVHPGLFFGPEVAVSA